jgi:haloalkane dehalogenase
MSFCRELRLGILMPLHYEYSDLLLPYLMGSRLVSPDNTKCGVDRKMTNTSVQKLHTSQIRRKIVSGDSSNKFPYAKKFMVINGKRIAYVDIGRGDPIVFLHGNPTSSYIWRNIFPFVKNSGRIIAPDLIGMGDSDKLDNPGPDRYKFAEHADYLYQLFQNLNLTNTTLVVHDWGSALGFNWTYINPDKVKSLIYMEAIVEPIKSWKDWPDVARNIFQAFRSDAGEELILQKNIFVEKILAKDGALSQEDLDVYMAPYINPGEDRRPTLTWPRQIPIEGEPKEVVEVVKRYGEFLEKSAIPKLFINANPGSILVGEQRETARRWANQMEVTVNGGHFIQEISPSEIGGHIKNFLANLN